MAFTSAGKKTNVFNSLGFSSLRAALLEFNGTEDRLPSRIVIYGALVYARYFHALALFYINTHWHFKILT